MKTTRLARKLGLNGNPWPSGIHRPAASRIATRQPPGELLGYSWVSARWTALDGRARTGRILVGKRLSAGHTVPLWVDATGSPAGHPLHPRVVVTEATAAVIATAALGTALLCLAWSGRRVLDRRRLAGWEAAWAVVGPQWTKRFRSRG